MGIKDLLPSLADVMQKDSSLVQLKGKRVAIDASAWLHKAIFATAEESMDLDFHEHMLYVDFLITRTRNFRLCGVEPILVFDGKRSSLKSDTNAKRSEERHTNMEQGRRLLASMKLTVDAACKAKLRAEAIAAFQKGMSVTAEVEKHAIAAMRRLGVTVYVAPYEADAQLAYLCHIGACDAVLTEDSDIIVYSALCRVSFPILYKFSTSGVSQKIESRDVFKEHKIPLNADGSESGGRRSKFLSGMGDFLSPTGSGRRMFVQMCILAGCDYSNSVNGIGLQFSQQVVARFKDEPDDERLSAIVSHWQAAGKKVPVGFLQRVRRAESLFFYHPVYDPRTKKVVSFMPPKLSADEQGICPLITKEALHDLGSEEDVMRVPGRAVPPGVSIADICEGRICRTDFLPIYAILPWEYPELAALVDHVPRSSAKSASWSLRRNLMGILRDQMHNRSPPYRNIPIIHSSRSKPSAPISPSVNINSMNNTNRTSSEQSQPISMTSTTAVLSRPSGCSSHKTAPASSPPKNKVSPPRPKSKGSPPRHSQLAPMISVAPTETVTSTTSISADRKVVQMKTQHESSAKISVVATTAKDLSDTPKRAILSEVSASTINIIATTKIERFMEHSTNSTTQPIELCTPQVIKTGPFIAKKVDDSSPCSISANPFLTDDTMWPQANGNSQHSISPLDKVVDLSASPADYAGGMQNISASGELIGTRKRKHADMLPLAPNRSSRLIPSVVQINADPRGAKRKKNGPTKTMNVASITSFFSVTTKISS